MCTEMKSVYTDFIDWLIFSGHWVFFFSVHQILKISVNRYTDFQKLVYTDFTDWLIFSGHWLFQCTPVFENQSEQIH